MTRVWQSRNYAITKTRRAWARGNNKASPHRFGGEVQLLAIVEYQYTGPRYWSNTGTNGTGTCIRYVPPYMIFYNSTTAVGTFFYRQNRHRHLVHTGIPGYTSTGIVNSRSINRVPVMYICLLVLLYEHSLEYLYPYTSTYS